MTETLLEMKNKKTKNLSPQVLQCYPTFLYFKTEQPALRYFWSVWDLCCLLFALLLWELDGTGACKQPCEPLPYGGISSLSLVS